MLQIKGKEVLSNILLLNLPKRINRKEFFILFTIWYLLLQISMYLAEILSGWFFLIGYLSLINLTILIVKRMHDFNYGGTDILLFIIPTFGVILGFALFLAPGTKGPNEFGNQPTSSSSFKNKTVLILVVIIIVAITLFLFIK